MGIGGNLCPHKLQSVNSLGYMVMKSFSSADEIESMRKRMDQLLDEFLCSPSTSVFSTKNQLRTSNDHFFDSAEKVSFFFEEKAFDDDGNLKQPNQLSINKVGHALHDLEPDFRKVVGLQEARDYSVNSNCVDAPSDYILLHLYHILSNQQCSAKLCLASFQQPGIGGEVVPYQDNSFLYTEPTTCTGLWLALEDATVSNGCLWAIPGSHKDGLVRRFIRDENGVHFDRPFPPYDQKDFVRIEVKAGDLVVIHGDLIHQSFENHSSKSRHAYSLHVIDTEGCKWAEDNWIRRTVDPEPLYAS